MWWKKSAENRELSLSTTFLKANPYIIESYLALPPRLWERSAYPRAFWDLPGEEIKLSETLGPATLHTVLTALTRMKWRSGGTYPSLQKSWEALDVKERAHNSMQDQARKG